MVEIKIYGREEARPENLIPNFANFCRNVLGKKDGITHFCLITEGDEVLGTSGIRNDGHEISLLFTNMKVDDAFLFDGLIKTVVHYAINNKYSELIVYDKKTLDYMEEKGVTVEDYSIDIIEFINKTSCSHRRKS